MSGGFPMLGEVCNCNDVGTDTANSQGTAVTPATGSKGSWTQIVASTTYDTCFMIVQWAGDGAGSQTAVVDIGVGSAGNEVVIVSNLMGYGTGSSVARTQYALPVVIPAGTRIAARAQAAAGTDAGRVSLILAEGGFGQSDGFAGVDAIGFDSANTRGTTITCSSTAHTKGSYAQLTASTPVDYEGLIVVPDENIHPPDTRWLVDLAIGGAGSEQVIVPNMVFRFISTDNYVLPMKSPIIPVCIPAGTRMAIRAQSDAAGTVQANFTVYGIYK